MFIYYRGVDHKSKDPVFAELKNGPASTELRDRVKCVLYSTYEPDRRYVAQFGVQRAPSLVLVHPDGTYHSIPGPLTSERILRFFVESAQPGQTPVLNPNIPREPHYDWHRSLASAKETAEKTKEPIFIVLDRGFSRDWKKLRKMLERSEVYARFGRMVPCRPGLFFGGGGDARKQFGVNNLPAIVVLQRSGAYEVLETPVSYEAIVRFADRALMQEDSPTGLSIGANVSP